jgi:Leucine-rich repeat (LRR) protein
VPPKSPKKSHRSPGKSSTGFAPFKGWFTEARQYFIALPLAIGAFLAFRTYVVDTLHWPKWTAWLAFIPPLLVFVFKTVPRLQEWWHERSFIKSAQRDAVKPIPSASAASYFLIGPYGEERRGKYARADDVHVKVLDWLQKTGERILILTGSSGTGKSSLLNAFVVPALRESKPPCAVLLVRSFDNPFDDLRRQLLKAGVIWDKPAAEKANLPLIELIQYAVARLRRDDAGARLFVVFDQFEEFVILHTERSPLVDDMKTLLGELQRIRVEGFVVLLSIRLDYRMFLEPLGVPALNLGNNWQDVPAFTFSDSARFITAPESGLQIAPERLRRILTEAAAVDGTRGLIRPIVLNMLGTVLGRIADSPAADVPTRNLLASDLRNVVNQKERRNVARRILPQMLTEADTKRPRSIGELSESTALKSQVILGCLLDLALSGYVRQISRPVEIADRIWEVSHDFVARLLGQILKTAYQTFWGRVGRILYPLSLVVWVIVAVALLVATPWLERVNSEQILRDRFSFFLHDEGNGYLAQEQKRSFNDLPAAIRYLVNFGHITALDLRHSALTNVDALKELKALQILYLNYCEGLTNVDGLKDLKALQTLQLNGCIRLTNVDALKELKALQKLDLGACEGLTNVDALKELKALQTLYLNDCNGLTNVDALKELKALQILYLNYCEGLTNVDGLKELKALQTLQLNGCIGLTNVDALKELKALQTLQLNGCIGLTPQAVQQLQVALPQAQIVF